MITKHINHLWSLYMQSQSHLLVDTDKQVLVDLSPGKLDKLGNRKKSAGQKGVTCLLSSLRRLSFFTQANIQTNDLHKAIKKIKSALEKFNGFNDLLDTITETCQTLGIDHAQIIKNHPRFKEYKNEVPMGNFMSNEFLYTHYSSESKFLILYRELIKRYYAHCNVTESNWTPEDGVNGLMNALRTHGAQMVIGKFGRCFHASNGCVRMPNQDEFDRTVYSFTKDSYHGDNSVWTHTVILDQVKEVNGKYFVFFRDPQNDSAVNQQEPVYMLSYESFISRLYDLDGRRYSLVGKNNNSRFTVFNLDPQDLTNPKANVANKNEKTEEDTCEGRTVNSYST